MMQKQTDEVVLSIAKGISTATGHIFFHSLMKHLAESLGADYAFIGELMKGHPGRVRTVVVWGHGRLADNFEYDLADTPCADVVRQQLCGYRSGIQQLFPLDQLLADMRIEGYVGAPLHDANKRTLGLLVVMFENPVENLALAESILNIFGVRAASELERQQREEALRESEQRLNLVLEATNSGVWDWKVRTGEVYFDDRWIKSLGYSPEEISQHVSFWEQTVHPEDLPRVRMVLRDHFQGRSLLYECEYRLRTKSGTYRSNLDRGKVVEWDADGRPLRMVGTNTDITNQKQLETQLRLIQFAIDRAADAIFIADTHKRFLYVNNEACRSLEYTRDELMKLTVFDVAPTHEPETFRKQFHILKEAGVVRYETIHRTKSGRDIPIDLTVNLFELNGTILMCAVARDITERKRAEQEQYRLIEDLTQSQQHFQALFNWTPSAVGISTVAEGRFIDVNDGFRRLTGYAREEVIGRTTLELGLWADPEERAFVLQEIREQGYLHNREGLLRTKSGEIRSLMVSVESIQLGSTPCLIYLGHDITERKRAEVALRESEQRYRTLMAHAPEAVVVLDVDRARFIYVNENAVRLFGLPREALLQADPIELSPPTQPDGRSSRETAFGLIRAAVNGGTPVFEWVYRTAAGADITCEVRLVRLPASGLVLVRGSVTDITARKQAEEALHESQGRFRELAENIKEVFWMSDPQKNEILYVSPAYEQIWGRTCESLYASPRSWLEAVHTEDRARILDAAVTKQATGTYDEEYRVVQPAGSTRWIHDRAFPVRDAAGTVCRIVGIAEDITERKQAEGQVQQSLEQLRELSGQLEMAEELERKRIARELHDEFGQMITALKLDLTWLRRQHGQAGNGRQPDAFAYKLEAMEKVVNTMAQSTRRIASSLRPSVLDDLGLVPALQWQARNFQERTGLECEIRLSADVAQRQIDDATATAFFRIAQELLTNIIRHANAQRVQISLAADDGVLVMIVTDDGKGIMENDLAKPTSFGLRGIRERATLIGGEIKIDGAPHQGTSVTLRVPLTRPEQRDELRD